MNLRFRRRGHGMITLLAALVLLALLLAAVLSLYRPLREWARLRRDLAAARIRLDDLKILYPLYAELAALDEPKQWPGLKPPPPRRLTGPEVTAIPERFVEIVGRCGMELGAVSPQVQTDEAGRRMLRVEVRASGPYAALHPLLLELVRMPEMERLDKLEIRRESLNEEYGIWARLALEEGGP